MTGEIKSVHLSFDLNATRSQYHDSIIMINTDTDNSKIKNDTKIQTVENFSKNQEMNFPPYLISLIF